MSSNALSGLLQGTVEVDSLLEADPAPAAGISPNPAVTRVIIRGAIVLLCGHFERYFRSVMRETLEILNQTAIDRRDLHLSLRLLHSRYPLDEISQMQWNKRHHKLEELILTEGWLWQDLSPNNLNHERLLRWFKTPNMKNVVKFYQLWGIDNVLEKITRKRENDRFFRLQLDDLVDKRNKIAHGEFTVEATKRDVLRYKRAAREFCERCDRLLARTIQNTFRIERPW